MAKEKLVKNITSRDEDFAQWYTDVVREANLCDYSSVKRMHELLTEWLCDLGTDPVRSGQTF